MSDSCLWISGTSRSGKTTRLVKEFQNWVNKKLAYDSSKNSPQSRLKPLTSTALVLASNSERRNHLTEELSNAVGGSYPVLCKTPLGFISEQLILFWPLLLKPLQLKPQFPLRLRPETEQELATLLWCPYLSLEQKQLMGGESRLVRRLLDLLQLAGASGTPLESIPEIVNQGFDSSLIIEPELIGKLLLNWRQWCLERGLLTYGLIYDLYWSYLLPQQEYRQYLTKYEAIFADDLDDYPAIARDLLEFWLEQGKAGIFTYNPAGQVRQGLNADPEYLQGLSDRCVQEKLEREFPYEIVSLEDKYEHQLSERWRLIQTTSRAELLRQVSAIIITKVTKEGVKPGEIAVIAPGLDEIGRYTLIEILSHHQIPVEALNEQRPLSSSPVVRALLTLLGLVYPSLGTLIKTEACREADPFGIAEMLVVISSNLDPVRAGLLADYCYQVDPDNPKLLPIEVFPRWDRLGARATYGYEGIINWISQQKQRVEREKITPIGIINQGIADFFRNREDLNYEKLAVLRKFVETAQHYWEVDRRLRENETKGRSLTETIADFRQLLGSETITANPYPRLVTSNEQGKITLATIFQYRSLGSQHRWQFWLDIGSPLWSKGGSAMLWGAPLFWRSPNPQAESDLDTERLERIFQDLQARATEGIYLCHSELNINGSEQSGPLLPLIYKISQ
ncbi:MAG: recombinase family protein [Gloeocapsa sp. DLM2.Bin57]|nr:MAG: recombinase family protein [Gloeocapsa sp. DLM2.Bin57]